MATGVAHAFGLYLLTIHLCHVQASSVSKTFTFPEYPYKETSKNVSLIDLIFGECMQSFIARVTSHVCMKYSERMNAKLPRTFINSKKYLAVLICTQSQYCVRLKSSNRSVE